MVGTFFLLATEEGGFGLNFDIIETNLINLTILIALLIYFGRSFFGQIMADRQQAIQSAIQDAEKRQREATLALSKQKENLAQAQSMAAKIKAEAEKSAQAAREEILAQAVRDVKRMQDEAARDLSSQRDRVLSELRQRVSALAINKVESQLRSQMDNALQQRLIDQSIALLGGRL
ncbi:F0F1 ATP synthase subunit B [Leptothoe spongobia]|uniref:ATP synthase subunit b n=1 Tax=Leptothoe spongobia TAU-MAC 1115 TaxID=1967444 RepID=A0A947DE40_9CYAN|nr:F0F1 ATP synthase subunit B [Leptothoe spongobia]MBT9314929.1 F0F1 ATP synthase subunit B [Leptothoe spongobia TAU-MAC 1115]